MNDNDDISNLSDTAAPKSDQLSYDDFSGNDKIITVTKVTRGATKEQPVNIEYDGDDGRPYKPCKSMRRVLLACWGEDGREWVGRKMKLYGDSGVKFGGVAVGGIRIKALSHITEKKSLLLSTTRGKRSAFEVDKLDISYPQSKYDANVDLWIVMIKNGELTVNGLIERSKKNNMELTAAQIEDLKTKIGEAE